MILNELWTSSQDKTDLVLGVVDADPDHAYVLVNEDNSGTPIENTARAQAGSLTPAQAIGLGEALVGWGRGQLGIAVDSRLKTLAAFAGALGPEAQAEVAKVLTDALCQGGCGRWIGETPRYCSSCTTKATIGNVGEGE